MKKLKIIIASVITFILLFTFTEWLYSPHGIILQPKDQQSSYYHRIKQPEIHSYYFLFNKTNKNVLIINNVEGTRIQISLNGVRIYDYGSKTGNIWNKNFIIKLDKASMKKNNKLKITLTGLYNIGLKDPYLVSESKGNKLYLLFKFSNEYFILFTIGANFIIGVILIFIFVKAKNNKTFLYFGLSTLLISIYLLDYVPRIYNGNVFTYLLAKKIFVSCAILSSMFMLTGMEKILFNKVKSKFLNIASLTIVIYLLFTPNFNAFKSSYDILSMIILLNLFSTVIITLKGKKRKYIFLSSFLFLSAFQSLILLIFKLNGPEIIYYGIFSSAFIYGAHLVVDYHNLVQNNEIMRTKAVTDQLTNAYNRQIIDEITQSVILFR